ncbi:MAG TPA: hypothetical protein VHD55_03010 [Candidatus Paceibacterota bacterium]|nr:hypothetical protein [Candidatus Paceibacterota bacterium]
MRLGSLMFKIFTAFLFPVALSFTLTQRAATDGLLYPATVIAAGAVLLFWAVIDLLNMKKSFIPGVILSSAATAMLAVSFAFYAAPSMSSQVLLFVAVLAALAGLPVFILVAGAGRVKAELLEDKISGVYETALDIIGNASSEPVLEKLREESRPLSSGYVVFLGLVPPVFAAWAWEVLAWMPSITMMPPWTAVLLFSAAGFVVALILVLAVREICDETGKKDFKDAWYALHDPGLLPTLVGDGPVSEEGQAAPMAAASASA